MNSCTKQALEIKGSIPKAFNKIVFKKHVIIMLGFYTFKFNK